jgi:hypothetical protein
MCNPTSTRYEDLKIENEQHDWIVVSKKKNSKKKKNNNQRTDMEIAHFNEAKKEFNPNVGTRKASNRKD